MPVYLVHGFRWPRPLIRIHIILHDVEDAAAEWIVAPGSSSAILDNFEEVFPDVMQHLPSLRLLEQHDPEDFSEEAVSQPYAYVADVVHEVKLGIDVDDVRGKGVTNEQWSSLLELRDKIAPDAKVGWFIVVCGDEERYAPSIAEESESEAEVVLPYVPIPVYKKPVKPSPAIQHNANGAAQAGAEQERVAPQAPVRNGSKDDSSIRAESIGYPTRTDGIVMQERNNSRSARDSNSSAGYSHYESLHRPRTAGSVYTSASSRTTRGTSSPDASRRGYSNTDLSQKGNFSSPESPQSGLRRILSSLKRRRSTKSLRDSSRPGTSRGTSDAPPVPALPQQRP